MTPSENRGPGRFVQALLLALCGLCLTAVARDEGGIPIFDPEVSPAYGWITALVALAALAVTGLVLYWLYRVMRAVEKTASRPGPNAGTPSRPQPEQGHD